MKVMRARMTALTVLAILAAVGVAACGSSSNTSSSTSSAAAAAGGRGGPGNPAARAKLTACLKQHGVTLPSRPAGGGPPTSGQRRGSFGGGGSGRFSNPKFRAAFQACGAAAGFRGRAGGGAGPGGGRFRPTQAAVTKFAACAQQHGYTLPKANLSGKGPIYPAKIESNARFQKAAQACQSLLRPAGGGPGGGPPSGSGTSTSSGT